MRRREEGKKDMYLSRDESREVSRQRRVEGFMRFRQDITI